MGMVALRPEPVSTHKECNLGSVLHDLNIPVFHPLRVERYQKRVRNFAFLKSLSVPVLLFFVLLLSGATGSFIGFFSLPVGKIEISFVAFSVLAVLLTIPQKPKWERTPVPFWAFWPSIPLGAKDIMKAIKERYGQVRFWVEKLGEDPFLVVCDEENQEIEYYIYQWEEEGF